MNSADHRQRLHTTRIHRSWMFWRIIIVMLVVTGVHAEPAAPVAEMHIKPKLCVRGTSADRCHLEISITWRSSDNGKYCLYNEKSLEPLRCWIKKMQGDTTDRISIKKDLDYWLAWQINNDELTRKTLKVLTVKSDDRRRSRRRRHVWSLF